MDVGTFVVTFIRLEFKHDQDFGSVPSVSVPYRSRFRGILALTVMDFRFSIRRFLNLHLKEEIRFSGLVLSPWVFLTRDNIESSI